MKLKKSTERRGGSNVTFRGNRGQNRTEREVIDGEIKNTKGMNSNTNSYLTPFLRYGCGCEVTLVHMTLHVSPCGRVCVCV